jgi:tetratricopeptide (TPR) repeat protein
MTGMISKLVPLCLVGALMARQTDSVAAGNRALDHGRLEEAAADFAEALRAGIQSGLPAADLLHLRITLATTYMEAGRYRETEDVLNQAHKTGGPVSGITRAELLNAWSALHLRLGQLSTAEGELQEAWRLVIDLPNSGDLVPAILNNLAAIEMRTGQYGRALEHEHESLRLFREILGPDHPTLIRAWASLASAQYLAGRSSEARLSLDQALSLAEKAFGPGHPLVADLLESEVVVLDKLKQKKNAREARDRARQIRGGPRDTDDSFAWSIREIAPVGNVSVRSK